MTTNNSELEKKRAELWKLFDSTPEYKGDGRGTVDRFFDILIPYIHTENQRAVEKLLKELNDIQIHDPMQLGTTIINRLATINQSKEKS